MAATTIEYKLLTRQEQAELAFHQCSQLEANQMRCPYPSRHGVIHSFDDDTKTTSTIYNPMQGYCRRHFQIALAGWAATPDEYKLRDLDEPNKETVVEEPIPVVEPTEAPAPPTEPPIEPAPAA